MLKIVLVVVLLTSAIKARPNNLLSVPKLDGRIVGGKNANIEDFPYQISLQYFGNHKCGGSIIGSDTILTAAHCVVRSLTRYLKIRYGTSIKEVGGDVVPIRFIDIHHLYNPFGRDYDVAIILLDGKIELSTKAQIIPLVSAGALEGDRSAVVTGWGDLVTNGPSPTQLQSVVVDEVSREECNESYKGKITDKMICFSGVNKDSCHGDSGGPLVSDGAQIGIVSWGYGCADSFHPGVYAHVDNLRGFISKPRGRM